jgi:hypothetical protein
LRKAVDAALNALPDLPEWQEPEWVARQAFPPSRNRAAHAASPA